MWKGRHYQVEKKMNNVVPIKSQLPANMDEFLEQHAGEGTSQRSEDNVIPLLYLLQDGSPQVKSREPKYIVGANAGDILLTSTQHLYKGSEGILFQPCAFEINWTIWVPRDQGGGFRGRCPDVEGAPEYAGAEKYPDPKNARFERWHVKDETGKWLEMNQVRNHYGFLIDPDLGPIPALLPLTSTGHQVSKNWMVQMNSHRLPNGAVAPSYAYSYRLVSTIRKNPGNPDSFTWAVRDGARLSDQQIFMGYQLHADIASGAKQAATPEEGTQTDGDDSIPF